MNVIPHNKPCLNGNEVKNATAVIQSNWLIAGQEVKKFEQKIAKLIGRKYAVALTSGTSALHLSLLALGVTTGDEVILSSYTPSDLINAIFYVGASPVFADIEKNSVNLDPDVVKKKITKKTKAIIAASIFGIPARLDKLIKLDIPLINDSAHALGSKFIKKPLGSYGDVTILSLYATKIVTTGQGGILATDRKDIYEYVRDRIDYNARDNYEVRYNYPLTDLAASIGNAQLQKLNIFLKRRAAIAKKYTETLAKQSRVTYLPNTNNTESNNYRFILIFPTRNERELAKHIFTKNKIITIVPLSENEMVYAAVGGNTKGFANTEKLVKTSLSLPIFPCLTNHEVQRIRTTLTEVLSLPHRTLPRTG